MRLREFTMYVDDTDIEIYNMRLVKYEVQSYAKRKTIGINIPGAHGTQSVPSALESADFVVSLVCTGTDTDSVNTKIREFFAFMYSTGESRKIVFSDDETIVRYAVLDSPDKYRVINGVDGSFAELKLNFHMLDPFMYDSEMSRVVDNAEHGKELIVNNEAFECPAEFTIENAGNSAVTGVALIVNNELVSFSCSLSPGDVLTLDTIEYEVKLNDVPHLEYWSGEMPLLKNGDNVIVQQNTQKARLLLSIKFTKQWV